MKKVWINGCFDVLHRGHVEMFKFAKSQGDFLVVGIDSDDRVRQLKGYHRPINNQEDRRFFLEAIRFIDQVVIFNTESDLIQRIKEVNPEIMIVGSDYRNKTVIGSEGANNLVFFNRIGNYSTTNILGKK